MHTERLLVAAMFVCSLPAFSQDHALTKHPLNVDLQGPEFRSPGAATPSDPWRIIPKSQWDKDKGLVLHSQDVGPDGIVVAPSARQGWPNRDRLSPALLVDLGATHQDAQSACGRGGDGPASSL